ncbi:lytic transglycosylase domain-containing protein [Stakelama saccharophila]|uniref:Lytic transglycosylase domain-containing protein n=1 Tax=Stakelama saccharophila TaxID=3075605 RepID=A0ABZ0B514_9SPHN|nr:lytic transglycosylase domain-containing protein [Stakelama sp. W311]WNO52468.1 lytic transglycosylase domain-containing protein [Stakelama sp. W311]
MIVRSVLAVLLLTAPVVSHAADKRLRPGTEQADAARIPAQLDAEQRAGYRAVFAAIRDHRWTDAQLRLDSMKPGPLHAIARAELYTAAGSPKVPLAPLLELLSQAPELPQAEQIARLAEIRGAETLPQLPETHRLVWHDGAPNRRRMQVSKSDEASARLAADMRPYLENDDGAGAEALLNASMSDLTESDRAEWLQRVAWIYYMAGDNADARRMASKAQAGEGEWAAHADWVQGLASWRQQDCRSAEAAFQSVAGRATDVDMRAAGLFWAARADMACGRPDLVEARLESAAQYRETFYGMLARQALGIRDEPLGGRMRAVAGDWRKLDSIPNVRVAAALHEIGEDRLADQVLRHQARIGDAGDYAALTRLAGDLNLANTQLWLSYYSPAGARPLEEARYPLPDWAPDGGWRVDKALVYAHTLQESKFDTDIVSPAGAYGLMQIMPAAANDIGRERGLDIDRTALTRPSTNMEVGQTYLERLRDLPMTDGLLPKVIAAYNAGPSPVQTWNVTTHANGDPLLYIESIPYWETRGYVMTVLRNYWMYERREGKTSPSRAALAQGLWPKFPGMPGAAGIRRPQHERIASASAD